MRLDSKRTLIATEKLRDYVLNCSHPEGESKARFLGDIGYEQRSWQRLEADLRLQHLSQEVSSGKQSMYGMKYQIIAPLIGPNGRQAWIRSIWIVRTGESCARFVTLVPEPKP